MGVYNPFAELPNSCVLCDSRKRCPLPNLNKHGLSVYRHPDCPLVEVKASHGDLIDYDVLYDITGRYDGELPVIIEAEGKDDG